MKKQFFPVLPLCPDWGEIALPPILDHDHASTPTPTHPHTHTHASSQPVQAPAASGANQQPTLSAIGTGRVSEHALGAVTGIILVVTESENGYFLPSDFVISAPADQEHGETLASQFEVQEQNGFWILKLKSGEALDYEALTNKTITLSLMVLDGHQASPAIEVEIAVTDIPEAPVIMNRNIKLVVQSDTSIGEVLTTLMVSHDEGDILTWEITAGDPRSAFVIDPQGRLILLASLTDDIAQSYALSVMVSDGKGGSDTATIQIQIAEQIVLDSIFENHPVNKQIAIITPPEGMAGADMRLADGALDNAHFRLDGEGKLWWLAKPDYENPGDLDADNVYQVEVVFTHQGVETRNHYELEVKDIGPGRYGYDASGNPDGGVEDYIFARSYIPDPEIPTGLAEYLIANRGFVMPTTGPLILTWALNPLSIIPTLVVRSMMEFAFSTFEDVINVKFIEVDYHDSLALSGDILVSFFNANPPNSEGQRVLGRAHYGDENWRIEFFMEILELQQNFDVVLHEIGHILGLKHPFHSAGAWPYDEGHRFNPASIMSYYDPGPDFAFLKAADVAALRFLYGEPDAEQGVSAERFMLFKTIQDEGERQTLRAVWISETIGTNVNFYRFSERGTIAQDAIYSLPGLENIISSRYELVDERDAEYFSLDPDTGLLRVKQKLDFDQPLDTYGGGVYLGNNVYEIKITVTYSFYPTNDILVTNNPNFIVTGGERDPVTGEFALATYIGSAYLAIEVIESITFDSDDRDIDLAARGSPQTPEADYRGKRVIGNDKDNQIRDGHGYDILRGNAGDDAIWLTATTHDIDRVIYRIGDHSAADGADSIRGFVRGSDRLILSLPDTPETRAISSYGDLIQYINGGTANDLSDDQFLVLLDIALDANQNAILEGLSFHFLDGALSKGGRVSMPVVKLSFAEPIDSTGVATLLNVDPVLIPTIINSDGVLTNLDYFDELMGGINTIGFVVEAL